MKGKNVQLKCRAIRSVLVEIRTRAKSCDDWCMVLSYDTRSVWQNMCKFSGYVQLNFEFCMYFKPHVIHESIVLMVRSLTHTNETSYKIEWSSACIVWSSTVLCIGMNSTDNLWAMLWFCCCCQYQTNDGIVEDTKKSLWMNVSVYFSSSLFV